MVRVTEEVRRLRRRFQERGEESQIWDVVQNARHQDRPYTLDYAQRLFGDTYELHGDRTAGDDPAIVAGIATYHGRPVVFVGHQKGRDLAERTHRNFGMARPEGYRKAIRAMRAGATASATRSSRSSTRPARIPASAPSSAARRA